MQVDHRRHAYRVVVLVGSIILVGGGGVLWNHHVNAHVNSQSAAMQVESHDVGSQIVNYLKQDRYDDAVEIGLRSLENRPSDEIIYQQITVVYLVRAQKDPDQREQWVTKAVSYADKALLLNSKNNDVAGVHLFQHARNFERAGDLSAVGRCAYYDRARKLLEDRVPLLRGDQLTLEGKTFPLGPLRKENERTLEEVKGKASKATCK